MPIYRNDSVTRDCGTQGYYECGWQAALKHVYRSDDVPVALRAEDYTDRGARGEEEGGCTGLGSPPARSCGRPPSPASRTAPVRGGGDEYSECPPEHERLPSRDAPNIGESHSETPVLEYLFSTPYRVPLVLAIQKCCLRGTPPTG